MLKYFTEFIVTSTWTCSQASRVNFCSINVVFYPFFYPKQIIYYLLCFIYFIILYFVFLCYFTSFYVLYLSSHLSLTFSPMFFHCSLFLRPANFLIPIYASTILNLLFEVVLHLILFCWRSWVWLFYSWYLHVRLIPCPMFLLTHSASNFLFPPHLPVYQPSNGFPCIHFCMSPTRHAVRPLYSSNFPTLPFSIDCLLL